MTDLRPPDQWIAPEQMFDGTDLVPDQGLRIEDGHVAEIGPLPALIEPRRIPGCLSPGFIDLQVNGGGGVQLNDTPTAAGMEAIALAHRRFGTVAILPTVITDRPEVLDAACEGALAARGRKGLIGLHIEGPHISVARRGTHAAEHVRDLDDRTLSIVARLRQADVPVMITLAPEAARPDQIAQLASLGAVVSVGHTDAPAEAIERAIAAGASCATHLFNAMSPMQSRAPGAVGAILDGGVHSGIICDGYHVDDRMVRLALRAAAKPDRLFLVSDSMATVGGPDAFALYGQTVRLDGGRLINSEGSLAGAHITQAQGVERLVGTLDIPPAQALRMAVTIPADLMGQSQLSTMMGRPVDDLLVLGPNLSLQGTLAEALGSVDRATEALNLAQ